jgi:hypothetical protein
MAGALKSLAGAAAAALTIYAFLPYIRGILRGTVRPHVFSWVIWGATTLVVFFAALQSGGGLGAWVIGLSATLTLFIAVLAWKHRADVTITRLDWLFLLLAASSLPLWYFTASPVWAVVVLTAVDLLGFGPTLRKAWEQPWSESMGFYGLFVLRNLLVVAALERYTLATWLFPVSIAVACALLIGLMALRRRAAPQPARLARTPDSRSG